MKLSKCHFFTKEIQYLGHILSTKGIQTLPSETQAIQNMHPPQTPVKPLTFLTCQQVKFDWTPTHHEAFLKLKESIIQAPTMIPLPYQEVHRFY